MTDLIKQRYKDGYHMASMPGQAIDDVSELLKQLAYLQQSSGEMCDECGWAMVLPPDGCVNCKLAEAQADIYYYPPVEQDRGGYKWRDLADRLEQKLINAEDENQTLRDENISLKQIIVESEVHDATCDVGQSDINNPDYFGACDCHLIKYRAEIEQALEQDDG